MRSDDPNEEDNNNQHELFDDVPETFLLCALHQAKIICERWKFWSGTVPMDVSIRLHRLESMVSMNEYHREKNSMIIPVPSLTDIQRYSTFERCVTEPQHQIVLQGPDRRPMVEDKRRVHFWCCH